MLASFFPIQWSHFSSLLLGSWTKEGAMLKRVDAKLSLGRCAMPCTLLLTCGRTVVQGIVADSFVSMLQQLYHSTQPSTTTGSTDDVLKTGVFSCDVCGVSPIQGKHWRCKNCEDFDLCDKCHSTVTSFRAATCPRTPWLPMMTAV